MILKRKCPGCRKMIVVNAASRFVTHPWFRQGARECPNSGETHQEVALMRRWAKSVREQS